MSLQNLGIGSKQNRLFNPIWRCPPKAEAGRSNRLGSANLYSNLCVINTRHSGKTSQLRKGLCEAVGMLMQIPVCAGQRQFAVVPLTQVTRDLAEKMLPRTKTAGIEVALVDGRGNVLDIT